jgi:hypothetical protein
MDEVISCPSSPSLKITVLSKSTTQVRDIGGPINGGNLILRAMTILKF